MGAKRCYVSVVNLYPKVIKRVRQQPNFEFVNIDQKKTLEILQDMVDLASLYGVQLFSCSNDALLKIQGMRKGHCINGKLLNRLGHDRVSERQLATRQGCGCTASIDIGDYKKTPCKYKCIYCYAR